MRRVVIGLLGLFLVTGCSSSYEPARSPHILTVVDSGTPVFVKDGVRVGAVGFGGGLADAMRGNPRAEQEARVGHNLVVGGFVLDIVGLGSEVGAGVALSQQRPSDRASGLALGLCLGGAAAVIAGSVLLFSGQPHIYDAVNIYNDGLDAAPTPQARDPR